MDYRAVVIIDDEPIILESLSEQISLEMGDQVIIEEAENAIEGFQVLDKLVNNYVKIVVIVADWLMPGIKGDEFLIRIHEKYPNIVNIILTGQADEDSIENARVNANLFGYMRKPWKKDELILLIKKGLRLTT